MKRWERLGLVMFFGLALMLQPGCNGGERTYPVSGQVEFEDGSPVMFGTIEFFNRESKLNARGSINRDGTFSVGTHQEDDGAVAGTHEVTIQQFVTLPLTSSSHKVEIDHDHGKHVAQKYSTYESSDLVVTVERKRNNEVKLVVKAEE